MPTYSELTITFVQDFEIDDDLKFRYDDNGVITNQIFTWVNTRSSGFEVTEGTPVIPAGETTAINFEAAFDLDNPAGYVTTQSTNTVTIQSETLGEDFVGIVPGVDNVGTYTVVFDNYVAPFDLTTVDMAFTRSPYYVNTPFYFDTTTKATIDLFIYSGDLVTDLPGTATVSLTKIRPSIDYAEFNTDIAKIIRDYLAPTPLITTTSVSQVTDTPTNSVQWCQYTASYTDTTTSIADITGTLIASDGFGYYSQGANPSAPTDQVLTDVTYRKVSRDGVVVIPFINDGTITSIDVDTDGAEVNNNHVLTAIDESTDYIQILTIDVEQIVTDTYITVTFNGTAGVYTYEIIDECRYEPKQIIFKNKYGQYDGLTLFKKSTTSLSVEDNMFVNNYITAGAYTTTEHQYQKINVEGKETISLNSGYIGEAENELYKQMLLSDKVYFWDADVLTPVNVDSKSLEFKTRINDSLVNYSIDFSYAYNIVQNV